ncbi:hypothetical protein N7478_010446 [Penicillium angulare]|uniref:uncharacterized protein n=1 Tax=Penicillium angulare TaxID=116970 RepID=UPI002541153B|nr:uncharacterized protein N7478_010446 [Penicillium angulare]KAJ5267638.1 hypothetical protein N7478_010446 [Penicillium angulare]
MTSSYSSSRQSARPMRQSRTRIPSYHEETTPDESETQEELEDSVTRCGSLSLRSRNTIKRRQSYREKSTDESLDELSDNEGLDDQHSHNNLPASSLPPNPSSTSSSAPRRSQRAAPSRPRQPKRPRPTQKPRSLGQPLKKRSRVNSEEAIFVGSGTFPEWHTLPYQVLFDIFVQAFYPLDDPKTHATKTPGKTPETKSATTLLGIALLCRGFSEAALAALYYRPPVFSAFDGHGLLNLLSLPKESLFINYAGKIKELYIDTETVLSLKSGPTLGYLDLNSLIKKTPQLHTLRLYHPEDAVFGHHPVTLNLAKWNYSPAFFSSIDESEIKLRAWEWNGRFLDTQSLIPLISERQLSTSFQGIKDIRFVHILNDPEDHEKEVALATSLKGLPELERLEFHECPIVADNMLEQLPPTLRSLTISNCDRINFKHIVRLFKLHGEQLRELNLNHNRHVSLEFMPQLGISCPRLEKFSVDVSMYDTSSYHDLEPHFDQLIYPGQRPTWPESLREIELYQLRHWGTDVGEMFFDSLVQAAPKMKDLRRIDVSAMFSGGWRDRARFRERWLRRLEHVFLRRAPPPNPDGRSLRKRPLIPALPTLGDDMSAQSHSMHSPPLTPSKRQSSRIALQRLHEDTESEEASSSDAEADLTNLPDCHGMCEHVGLRIDNQRPNDHQFNENDFLDDELSGDEDWDGDDFEAESGHAW